MLHHHSFSLTVVAVLALLSSASPNQPISDNLPLAIEGLVFSSVLAQNEPTLVNLRIEGPFKTIFEGNILTRGHSVTTISGGTHHCDGTNNNANPLPGPTCTSALDDASKSAHFPFDGPYSTEFDDFFITSIGGVTETPIQFWSLLLNFQFTQVGGCQQEVKRNDKVLFAFDAFNKAHFLNLTGPNIAFLLTTVIFNVTDGQSGSPVVGATMNGRTSDLKGQISFTFSTIGEKVLKAEKPDSIRSNRHIILII